MMVNQHKPFSAFAILVKKEIKLACNCKIGTVFQSYCLKHTITPFFVTKRTRYQTK